MTLKERLIVSLDLADPGEILEAARSLKGAIETFKLGMVPFSSTGPPILEALHREGFTTFLDLKFHDIPRVVEEAVVRWASFPGMRFIDIHAGGGGEMIRRAKGAILEGAGTGGGKRVHLLAVTLLTSLGKEDLIEQSIPGSPLDRVLRLTDLALGNGADGVVASPLEAGEIRKRFGEGFLIVTPGIRPLTGDPDDQKRFSTPKGAIRGGADCIVVGRPILHARDRPGVVRSIMEEIEEGLYGTRRGS